jgi:UDP-N-acetylmuramoylalanine-D-glutamate ligase
MWNYLPRAPSAGAESPFVAITGTNGKSTTTALIAHILRDERPRRATWRQYRHADPELAAAG